MTKKLDEIASALKAHREAGEDGGPTELEMHCGEYLSYTLRIARAAEKVTGSAICEDAMGAEIRSQFLVALRAALEGKE